MSVWRDLTLAIRQVRRQWLACASVANLLLARGYARRAEIAVRWSLGAKRWTIVRQLLTEALVLAFAAGLVGVWITMMLPAYIFRTVPELAQSTAVSFQTDSRVLWYALGLSVAACVAFGLAPALHCTSVGIGRGLKSGPGSSLPSLKHSLPAYQVMISVILLVVARSTAPIHLTPPSWSMRRSFGVSGRRRIRSARHWCGITRRGQWWASLATPI
jgi:predicted lysophospholipase L1 biosynthesis ABC-type transport system permease subunit